MRRRQRRPWTGCALTTIPRAARERREDLPWIRFFARNLLREGYLTEDLLDFALTSVEPAAHAGFVDRIRAEATRRGTKVETDSWTPGDAAMLAHDIAGAAVSGRLPVPPRVVRELALESVSRVPRGVAQSGRLRELSAQFGLTAEESRILMLLHLRDRYPSLDSTIETIDEPSGFAALAAAAGSTPCAVCDAAGPSGTLRRRGLLAEVRVESGRKSNRLEPYVTDYLAGAIGLSIVDYFCEPLPPAAFTSTEFPVPERAVSIMLALLAAGGRTNLLLHGPPGVGKTELVRTLAAEAGLRALRVRRRPEETQDRYRAAVAAAIGLADRSRDLLVVDEADALLSGGISAFLGSWGTEKGWLNELLDGHDRKVAWVVNRIDGVDPSTRRRFDYGLAFREPDCHEREAVWRRLAERHGLSDRLAPERVRELAFRVELGPGAVDRCLSVAARTGGDVSAVLDELVEHQLSLSGGSQARAVPPAREYRPSLCATDVPLEEVTEAALAFRAARPVPEPGDALCVLLSGPPGTGKSAYARFLADRAGAPLVCRTASTLVSPWVGQTEANIAAAFREARERRAVLLVDEAESFLAPRVAAVRSYEVSQVNEFLTQMERHAGILVCCTNLVDRIDAAAMRRFTFKVEYRAPDAGTRAALFAGYFPDTAPDPSAAARLRSLTGLTPGDFAVVARRLRLTGGSMPAAGVIDALERELRYRNPGSRAIGFSAER